MIKRLAIVGLIVLGIAACSGQQAPPGELVEPPPPRDTPLPTATFIPRPQPSSSPAIQPTPQPTEPSVTRLWFTGDINPGRCIAQMLIAADDYTIPYQALAADLSQADILVGSLDGAITDRADPANCPKTMSLNGTSRVAEGLAFAGFDLITVATNHAKNCGDIGCWDEALLDSMDNLRAQNITVVGGGSNLNEAGNYVILEHQGVKFAFIGASTVGSEMWATDSEPGTNPLTDDLISQQIAAARQHADVVIVLAQWGSEYTHVPNWDQFNLAGTMMDSGAALVIGNQAHWVQATETFPTGVVAYGLGNFVFDQNWSLKTRQGVIFEAVFRGSQLESWQLLPIVIEKSNYQPRWATPEEANEILGNIEAASHQAPLTTRDLATPTAP